MLIVYAEIVFACCTKTVRIRIQAGTLYKGFPMPKRRTSLIDKPAIEEYEGELFDFLRKTSQS